MTLEPLQARFSAKEEVKIEFTPLEKVKESWWNMNVMPETQFKALVEDMDRSGPLGIDPVLTASMRSVLNDPKAAEDIQVCIDGNHRLLAARKLGWKNIRTLLDPSIANEEVARMISYNKNYERGNLDAFKEGENFKWLREHGWKDEKIAEVYHIDRTTVVKRVGLLKVEPEVKTELLKVEGITASHLEPISTLRPEQQKEVLEEVKRMAKYDEAITVSAVEDEAKSVKQATERREQLVAAIAKSKFQNCPRCGKPAESTFYEGLPWVTCKSNHPWSLETGKLRYPYDERAKGTTELAVEKPKEPEVPAYVNMTYTMKDFKEAFMAYARAAIPQFTEIEYLDINGKTREGRSSVTVDLQNMEEATLQATFGRRDLDLGVKPTTYKSKDMKEFKTKVSHSYSSPGTLREFKKLETQATEILQKFRPKKRGRPKKSGGEKKSPSSGRKTK